MKKNKKTRIRLKDLEVFNGGIHSWYISTGCGQYYQGGLEFGPECYTYFALAENAEHALEGLKTSVRTRGLKLFGPEREF